MTLVQRAGHAIALVSVLAVAAISGGCDVRSSEMSSCYYYDEAVRDHLQALTADATTRPRSIMNLGDSISGSDCFVWHERTRLDRPGMLSRDGYVYVPKEWSARGGVTSDWGCGIVEEALDRANPEVATILFGTNDLQAGRSDPQLFVGNVSAIVDACLANQTIPVLLAIPPASSIDESSLENFNAALAQLASRKLVPLIRTDLLFRTHGGHPSLCSDGVHPNSKPDGSGGYDLINRVFRELYERMEREVLGREPRVLPAVPPLEKTRDENRTLARYDRNRDGQADCWATTSADGSTLEEYDSDFDGQADVRWHFEGSYLFSGEENMARDGKSWIPFKMVDGWKNETP